MSYATIEKDPLPQFRNNLNYFQTKFQPPEGNVCCGSAYGSGAWYPDFGGYKGAPEMNRWTTPAEAWFERNLLKKKEWKEYCDRKEDEKSRMAALAFRKPLAMQTDRITPVVRGDDPLIKTRERLAIVKNHIEALNHDYKVRTRKVANPRRWKKNWGPNVAKKLTQSTPLLMLHQNYEDAKAMATKDTEMVFQGEVISHGKRMRRPTSPKTDATRKKSVDQLGVTATGFRNPDKILQPPWDTSQPRDWFDTKRELMGLTQTTHAPSSRGGTTSSYTNTNSGPNSLRTTMHEKFRKTM
ncbi:unnamed protein product [Amoebophrya sp. A25]|nr:unnamed protein product [Amoebophrya sp. A25]|eukprot:GSA25T00025774001.1